VLSPKIGAFNIHPGPLPQYAGLNCPSWAIYYGEKKHAVTLHRIESGIDTGAIVFDQAFDISERDTGLSVALRCAQLGVRLALKLLEVASRDPGLIPHRPQELGQRRYFGREVPQEGRIAWNKSARQIFDFIRACDYAPFHLPWGKPQTKYKDRQVAITKSALSGQRTSEPPGLIMLDRNGGCYVSCSDEWLEIKKVFENGRTVSPREYLSGGERFDVF